VQLADARDLTIDEVLDLTLRTPAGELVALRNVVEARRAGRRPRFNGATSNAWSRSPRTSPDAAGAVARRSRPPWMRYPAGELRVPTGGNVRRAGNRAARVHPGLVLALALVFMVLACQYESLKDPLIVMVATPRRRLG